MNNCNGMMTLEESAAYHDLVEQRDAAKDNISIKSMRHTVIATAVGTAALGSLGPGGYVIGGAAMVFLFYKDFQERRKYENLNEQVTQMEANLEGRI
jgi:hypothetical protein